MSKDVECPYCGHEFEICHDDGHASIEDEIYHEQCPKCEKNFVFTICYHISYREYKADCLNGGEHDYQRTITFPPECARMRCTMCGDEKKPLPKYKKDDWVRFGNVVFQITMLDGWMDGIDQWFYNAPGDFTWPEKSLVPATDAERDTEIMYQAGRI